MRLRSLLFVPGDRPDRMEKAMNSGADALILDLEDSVTLPQKDVARRAVADFLTHDPAIALFVRINPVDSAFLDEDLAAVVGARPYGLVLPKAEGAATLDTLEKALVRHGATADLKILPITTETPAAIFQLGSYVGCSKRLCGLTWGAEDLPAAIGATSSREADGRYTAPYETVRALTLFAAHAAGVPAIETVVPDFRNLDRVGDYAARGRRDGFSGMMAIHPAQVPAINAAFSPTPAEIAAARAIVEAFAASPAAGALQIEGRMIDAPHLRAAERLLAQSGSEET